MHKQVFGYPNLLEANNIRNTKKGVFISILNSSDMAETIKKAEKLMCRKWKGLKERLPLGNGKVENKDNSGKALLTEPNPTSIKDLPHRYTTYPASTVSPLSCSEVFGDVSVKYQAPVHQYLQALSSKLN